jgi:hypothetical protein
MDDETIPSDGKRALSRNRRSDCRSRAPDAGFPTKATKFPSFGKKRWRGG